MFKTIKVTFDFGRLVKKLSANRLLTDNQKKRINTIIAERSREFIENDMTDPASSKATFEIRERIHKVDDQTTMIRSGNLVDSIRGTKKGVEMVDYGKYQLEGFNMQSNAFTEKLGIPTPQFVGPRDFIASDQGVDEELIDDIADEIIDTIIRR